MRTRTPGRLATQAVTVRGKFPGQSVGFDGCRKLPEILLRVPCGLGPEPPAASKPFAGPVHRRSPAPGAARVRFLLAPWSVQSIIVRPVTGDLIGILCGVPVITAVLGDITKQNVDAIVNAANNAMRGGGGVDGAIHRNGGPAILRDCIERFPNGLATGDAGWTTAGELPAQWVIHTVGPNYNAGQRDRSLLKSCYRRALQVADELGARSVAFPLISTGIYGWPRRDAIGAAIDTIAASDTRVAEVQIMAFDPKAPEEGHARLAASTRIRILQGVQVLHRLGYHRVRALPGMSPSGVYWRVGVTTADNLIADGGPFYE